MPQLRAYSERSRRGECEIAGNVAHAACSQMRRRNEALTLAFETSEHAGVRVDLIAREHIRVCLFY